jgi:hypothetical protein
MIARIWNMNGKPLWKPGSKQAAMLLHDGLREFKPRTDWDHGYHVGVQHALSLLNGEHLFIPRQHTVRIWLRKKT